MRVLVSVFRIDLPEQRTGQYPTFYPSGIESNGVSTGSWAVSGRK